MERLLIPVDASENSRRAVAYASRILRDSKDAEITLFHVLKTIPRSLMEHGGSDDPAKEGQLSETLRHDQEAWLAREQEVESPAIKEACNALRQTGFDPGRVLLKFSTDENVARAILEIARREGYETIVVGRRGESSRKDGLTGKVTEKLLHGATGLTIWIVE